AAKAIQPIAPKPTSDSPSALSMARSVRGKRLSQYEKPGRPDAKPSTNNSQMLRSPSTAPSEARSAAAVRGESPVALIAPPRSGSNGVGAGRGPAPTDSL